MSRGLPDMDRDSHSEDTLSTMVLENIKNKLIRAFRATAESRGEHEDRGVDRSQQANEELRRAQIDGALTWLRSELVRSTRSTSFTLVSFSPLSASPSNELGP